MKERLSRLKTWMSYCSTSDDADSVLITFVLTLPLLILIMGCSIDFSKNVMIRGDYSGIAQAAVQTAIRYQDGVGDVDCSNTGWLNWNQAVAYVNSSVNSNADGSAQAVATYMMKTGRANSSTFNSQAAAKFVYSADTDYTTVLAFRDFAHTKSIAAYSSTFGDSTSPTDSNYFGIRVTCSNLDTTGTTSRGAGNTDRVTLDVKDWTSNMFLTLPTDNNGNVTTGSLATQTTQLQKFNINKSAISSYSASSVK